MNEGISIERYVDEKPKIEEFPELEALTKLNNSETSFSWNGKDFKISSYGKEIFSGGGKRVVIGLWEKSQDGTDIPAGFIDSFIENETALLDIKSHDIEISERDLPQEYSSLENIQVDDTEEIDSAFVIASNYRGTGLGDVFNAQFMVVAQALGVEKISYIEDLTIHTDTEKSYRPQFKGTSDNISYQPSTSFYSKYSTEHKIEGNERTTISSTISAMQESLLHEAFGHYN